jgi:hypothetical protein
VVLAVDLRRQARVCAGLAEDCEDQHLAERLKAMARDLIAKADDLDEPVRYGAAEPTRLAS